MKTKIILLSLLSLLLFSNCGTQKFYIGDTSGKEIQSQKSKFVKVLWVFKIGKKQSFSATGADGYIIVTKYKLVDAIVSGLTVGIVNMKSVKFEAYKTSQPIKP
ncbi:MAG TPA: hypothetical protein VN026_01915 [Bacteroidia bacterium]|jgi:hypothetical protein|nr:hypothetical protein [Bacteroidia bacterium]